jgi:hypothetical protein
MQAAVCRVLKHISCLIVTAEEREVLHEDVPFKYADTRDNEYSEMILQKFIYLFMNGSTTLCWVLAVFFSRLGTYKCTRLYS